MKEVKISIRTMGKTMESHMKYVDKDGKTHETKKIIEKGDGGRYEAELKVLLESLKSMNYPVKIKISASAYVMAAIKNNWIQKWHESDGKKYDGTRVKNWELWQQVGEELKKHEVIP